MKQRGKTCFSICSHYLFNSSQGIIAVFSMLPLLSCFSNHSQEELSICSSPTTRLLLFPHEHPETFFIFQAAPAIHAIQRKLRSIDKMKHFIVHEGKAAEIDGRTQYFDGAENVKCYGKGMVKIAFRQMNFLMGEGSLDM